MKELINKLKTKISKKEEIKIEPGETELDYFPLNDFNHKDKKSNGLVKKTKKKL